MKHTIPIRLVIVDDHVLVRQGIRAFLETHADLSIVGEAEDAATATAVCAEQKPQVALVDLVMPGGGIAATRDIRAASPSTQVVLLTSFDDAQQILAAIQAGALSCLLKDRRCRQPGRRRAQGRARRSSAASARRRPSDGSIAPRRRHASNRMHSIH